MTSQPWAVTFILIRLEKRTCPPREAGAKVPFLNKPLGSINVNRLESGLARPAGHGLNDVLK
jgi:hypothetical protein